MNRMYLALIYHNPKISLWKLSPKAQLIDLQRKKIDSIL